MDRVASHCKTRVLDVLKHVLTSTIRTPSLWYETCIDESQYDAHQLPALSGSYSPSVGRHISQSGSQIIARALTATRKFTKYAQLEDPATSYEARPNNDHHATHSLPSTALAPVAQPVPSSYHLARPCLHPKSEKDKMPSGEPFLPDTARLVGERDLCSQALFRFNTIKPSRCNTAEASVSYRRESFFERLLRLGGSTLASMSAK